METVKRVNGLLTSVVLQTLILQGLTLTFDTCQSYRLVRVNLDPLKGTYSEFILRTIGLTEYLMLC